MPTPKLDQLSDADLEREMERRRQAKATIPARLPNPNFSTLINMVEEGLKTAVREKWMDDDQEHYIVEEVYKAIYGPKFYDWYNKAGIDH